MISSIVKRKDTRIKISREKNGLSIERDFDENSLDQSGVLH